MTGPRNVAAVASLVLLCSAVGCTNFYEVPIETPIQPKMDVTPFTRILVAGFISGGSDDVDGNLETVRLLRSQLRSKSSLRVIEAEVLPLVEIAREQTKSAASGSSSETVGGGPGQSSVDPVPPLPPAPQQPPAGEAAPQQPPAGEGAPQQLPPAAPPGQPGAAAGVESTDGKIRNEKDLERYQAIFENVAFWKKLGEQHQNPLIVTGTVLFTNTQSSGFVNQNREIIDPLGRRVVQPYRVYMERKGFIIEPRFVFIDGRTGAVLFSDRFHEEVLYPASQQTPALSSYFELMDRLIPSFLGSLSTQRIRGTRVLLK
jgi:hypothetical protein